MKVPVWFKFYYRHCCSGSPIEKAYHAYEKGKWAGKPAKRKTGDVPTFCRDICRDAYLERNTGLFPDRREPIRRKEDGIQENK